MKYRHLVRVDPSTLAKDAYDEICALAPEGRKPYGFHLQLDLDSPDGGPLIRRITDICITHGLKRRRVPNVTSFGHSADRLHDPEDYIHAELLVIGRQKKVEDLGQPQRDEDGRLLFTASKAKSSLKIGRIQPNWIIVSDKVRQALETARPLGLLFKQVTLKGSSLHAGREPFWEIQSSIILPKMANTHQFVHPGLTEVEPFRGDYSKIVMLNDPPFNKGEVHYRRKDLASTAAFDIASTFENYMEPHTALVISQRFYRHFLKTNIPLQVDPVRVDPD